MTWFKVDDGFHSHPKDEETMNIRRVPNEDFGYQHAARRVLESGGEVELNEYGAYRSVHHCATCGHRFTVTPPSTNYGPDCIGDTCPSYDPARDATIYFAPDDPELIR